MSKQKATKSEKLNKLNLNKETLVDLDVKQADKVKGGTQLVNPPDPVTRPVQTWNCIKPQ